MKLRRLSALLTKKNVIRLAMFGSGLLVLICLLAGAYFFWLAAGPIYYQRELLERSPVAREFYSPGNISGNDHQFGEVVLRLPAQSMVKRNKSFVTVNAGEAGSFGILIVEENDELSSALLDVMRGQGVDVSVITPADAQLLILSVTPADLFSCNPRVFLRNLVYLQVKLMYLTGDGPMSFARNGRWMVIETSTLEKGRIIYALFDEEQKLTLITDGDVASKRLVEGILGDFAARDSKETRVDR